MSNYKPEINEEHKRKELLSEKRQEQALREFKELLADLNMMLRQATDMETVYMYWVNQARGQFVLETTSTRCPNTMFQDRVEFENHFLFDYATITEPIQLEVGKHLDESELNHYYDSVPVRFLTLIPFVNNGQTIAITVMESKFNNMTEEEEASVFVYEHALSRLLNTYLEVSDLSEDQQEWLFYEESLQRLESEKRPVEILTTLMSEVAAMLPKGGVFLVARGMNAWTNVLNSVSAFQPPPIGMQLEERTIAYDALQKGSAEFSIHFNSNPKRLASREPQSYGATIAVPLSVHDRRQAVLVAYDENPLIFKQSVKHKITNLARVASLKLTAEEPRRSVTSDLLSHDTGAFLPDLWEKTLALQLRRIQEGVDYHTWFGFVTIENLSGLRSRHRFEDLQQLQKELIRQLNPSNFDLTGFIGSNTDYVYAYLIQSRDPNAIQRWNEALASERLTNLQLHNGQAESLSLISGGLELAEHHSDVHSVVREGKSLLSDVVKSSNKKFMVV